MRKILHSYWDAYVKKDRQEQVFGKNVGKLASLYTFGKDEMVNPLWKTVWHFLKMLIRITKMNQQSHF